MPLINCEINLALAWSLRNVICVLFVLFFPANQAARFAITNIKLYVPLLVLPPDYNEKLLQQIQKHN